VGVLGLGVEEADGVAADLIQQDDDGRPVAAAQTTEEGSLEVAGVSTQRELGMCSPLRALPCAILFGFHGGSTRRPAGS
jgi:hypothetical protein